MWHVLDHCHPASSPKKKQKNPKIDCHVHPQEVVQLSPDQIRDMLLLRHIHIARREQLANERKQLMSQMAESHGQAWQARENVSRMALLTKALTDNAAQDYQIDAEVQCAALRGVRCHTLSLSLSLSFSCSAGHFLALPI